ncbi:hypothetical protein [Streptomyces sp. NPDC059850]|uniref:hypothetical protein n=1 Tax=Streptomyces sp. NPDC059850 TaxID=3346970 RepID=UPI0036558B74
MNIGKKVAVLAATAGALVLGSAGGASAHGGYGGFDPFGTIQTNACDTAVGTIVEGAVTAPSGDINIASNCINFTSGTAAVQSNECDTAVGTIVGAAALAPTGDTTIGSNCTNIATGTP